MHLFPLTSPIIFIISDTFAFGLLLSIIAIGVFNASASFLARVTPPWSGETTTTSSPSFTFLTEESHRAMDIVKQLRSQGYKCYFTMDAGPNVKVLYLKEDQDKLYEEISKLWNKKIILCME